MVAETTLVVIARVGRVIIATLGFVMRCIN